MPSSVKIRLADESDNGRIISLMLRSPMPSAIRFSVDCSPSFAESLAPQGSDARIIVAEKGPDIVALGAALRRKIYLDGKQAEIGYLGSLRIEKGFRGSVILARGYKFLREVHESELKLPFYLSSILEGNDSAMKILTSGRSGLPYYREIFRYTTYAIPAFMRKRGLHEKDLRIGCGSLFPLESIIDFLNSVGGRKQFFPVFSESSFKAPDGQFRNVSQDDFIVASDRGRIVGTLSVWDQTPFRRIVVEGYGRILSGLKKISSLVAKSGIPDPVPDPGKPVPIRFASCLAVKDDSPGIFSVLLGAALKRAAADGARFIVIGMPDGDPLAACVNRHFSLKFRSRIYAVSWDSGLDAGRLISSGNFHLDAGTL